MTTICFPDGLCTRITVSCVPPMLFQCAPGAQSFADCACVDPRIVVPPPTVSCIPPLIWNGTACVPVTPAPPPVTKCELSISFAANEATNPTLVSATQDAQCTAEGSAIALAIMISRLLK